MWLQQARHWDRHWAPTPKPTLDRPLYWMLPRPARVWPLSPEREEQIRGAPQHEKPTKIAPTQPAQRGVPGCKKYPRCGALLAGCGAPILQIGRGPVAGKKNGAELRELLHSARAHSLHFQYCYTIIISRRCCPRAVLVLLRETLGPAGIARKSCSSGWSA